ncbi:MAG: SDR family oxidoreductase [Trueperaceae bacterium]|nr:SDR family oxidoreductase [Trueperaceae bacterium]
MNRGSPLLGKHALVTGGGTGIGLAIARAMAEAGAQVTVSGRREDVLAAAVEALGAPARYVVGDVADLASTPELVARVAERAPIDVLVNNAGRHQRKPALETSDADFAEVIATNLHGTFGLTREVARTMVGRGAGSIIVVTSMAALFGIPGVSAYTASKSALDGLVRQLAVEFSPHRVRVNAIAPGFIETDMNRGIFQRDPARLERILARTPLGRLGDPADVAEAAVFLASDAASFVTGACLPVDGGASIGF